MMAGLPGIHKYFGGKNLISEKATTEELDKEWMQLIMEALEMGLKKEEIREFLQNFNGQPVGTEI
jgi:DNA-binding transcriptional regulator YhcF (GntR family)